jgi:hypothetical protein
VVQYRLQIREPTTFETADCAADIAGQRGGDLSKSRIVSPPGETVAHPTAPEIGLFQAKDPAECRSEYADAYDWGPDVGREVVRH